MTEPEVDHVVSEAMRRLVQRPAPPAPLVHDVVLAGRRVRGRRRRLRAGVGVAGVAAVGSVAAVMLTGSGAGAASHRVTLAASPAASDSASAPAAPADVPLTWRYWEVSYVDHAYLMRNGVPVDKTFETANRYFGNGAATVLDTGTASSPDVVTWNPQADAVTKTPATSPEYWQQVWDAPRDPVQLKAWVAAHRGSQRFALTDATPVQMMLAAPAPVSLRLALVSVLATFPNTTVTTGSDQLGRPSVITTMTQPSGGQSFQTLTDATTGELLETAVLAGKPGSPNDLPAGHVDFEYTYIHDEPVGSAPAVTPKKKDTIPPNTTGVPSCTPGQAGDPSNATAVALAKLCLPDPASGFPHRLEPDNYGDAVGRAFVVSTDAAGMKQIRLQVDADDQYFLSLATSPTPKNGKVGDDTYIGSRSVLGVTASEVTDRDGSPGLVLQRDGLGIEAFGSKGVSYDELAALTNQLQGLH